MVTDEINYFDYHLEFVNYEMKRGFNIMENIAEKEWTNLYIVGMYLLKNKNTNIKKFECRRTGNIIIYYYHEHYGDRAVVVTEDTDLERTFFCIDNDGDDDYAYMMLYKK